MFSMMKGPFAAKMVKSQENKEFGNALLACSYAKITELLSCLMKSSCSFDRETSSTLWKYLNINIPWMNMEVGKTSIVSKPVFSQGYAINTSLSCAPIWSGFGPKIRVASYLQDFLFFGG